MWCDEVGMKGVVAVSWAIFVSHQRCGLLDHSSPPTANTVPHWTTNRNIFLFCDPGYISHTERRWHEHFHILSGAPALSLGVFHQGRIPHTAHFGRKDASQPGPPDDDSIYHVASLLKILTVSAVAKIVHDGRMDWDVPVREYLPEFHRDDEIGRSTTIRDLVANWTGLPVAGFFWTRQNSELLLDKGEMVRLACHLEAVKTFPAVIGKPFSIFIQESLVNQLGLKNTTYDIPRGDNVAVPHAVRDDGVATKIEINSWTDESGITAGAGGKAAHGLDTTPASPFTNLRTIFEPHVKVGNSKLGDQGYCLGLYRTKLPGNLSITSWNLPLFGDKIQPFGSLLSGVEVYHHTMTILSFLGSMSLVLKSNSGVVVLTNATPKLDPTDLSAQCLLGVLLGERRPSMVPMAELGPSMPMVMYEQVALFLEGNRTSDLPSLSLHTYAGIYFNSAGNFFIHVSAKKTGLHLVIQGKQRVAYGLHPYHGDMFSWPVSREKELCNNAMWPVLFSGFHKVTFQVTLSISQSLMWHHDSSAAPEVSIKDTARSCL
ncbi:beta-lactamase/transpeptidase-like protein [Lentithecium fluviatile CBS 122367]|uniref:Beta-lactamase/transpeptidase-like protein n=1 Tax=Lentithecium fluviatile CBS 122367 TaxID=1168545 RepID=A0A6G1JDX3_9PLEO|nr:beta-lactamase/transpeptidase-like protein [Lentithecium fluviatile CBS 122367]